MPKQEIIDLSLSTDDEAPAPAPTLVPAHRFYTRGDTSTSKTRVDTDFAILSDYEDDDIRLADAWPNPYKRQRLSQSPGRGTEKEVQDIATRKNAPSNTINNTGRHKHRREDSDPIIFTSSPHRKVTASKRAKIFDPFSPLNDDSDNNSPEGPCTGPMRQLVPVPQLSDRTSALLASLAKSPALKKLSVERKKSHDKVEKKHIIRLPESGDEGNGTDLDPERVEKSATREVSRKPKLTDEERAAKAEEREASKAANKVRKAKERGEEMERKKMLKEEKAREKRIIADLAEVNKSRIDKKDSTPQMIVDLPASIHGQSVDTQIRQFLKNLDVDATLYQSPLPNMIKWRRKTKRRFNEERRHWEPLPVTAVLEEKHVMCLMSAKEFVALATAGSAGQTGQGVEMHVLQMKSEFKDCMPIYLIEGLDTWMRKNKTIRNRAYQAAIVNQDGLSNGDQPPVRRKKPVAEHVDEDMIEDALLRLQVMNDCLVHHTAATVETAEWVASFTQHISTIPDRHERMTLETSFCMESGQVKTGLDKDDTYLKMLQEVFRVTAPIAYGVAAEYSNVISLVKGLRKYGPTALENLKKSANKNGGITDRNIGPAISKRLYRVFVASDPGAEV